MNIIGVQYKDAYVTFEVSIQEIARILEYYDSANALYVKVMKDSDMTTGEYMEDDFIAKLRLIFEDVTKGVGDGS